MMLLSSKLSQVYQLLKLYNGAERALPQAIGPVVFEYLLEKPSSLVKKFLEDHGGDEAQKAAALATCLRLCKYLCQNPGKLEAERRKRREVVSALLADWSWFGDYATSSPLDVLLLAKLMLSVHPMAAVDMFNQEGFRLWFQAQLKSSSLSLGDKTKFLDLLPAFLSSSFAKGDSVAVRRSIGHFTSSFPLDSADLGRTDRKAH